MSKAVVTYELAVHLMTGEDAATSQHLTDLINRHRLRHPTMEAALAAGRAIADDEQVEWVNLSRVECTHVTAIRRGQ